MVTQHGLANNDYTAHPLNNTRGSQSYFRNNIQCRWCKFAKNLPSNMNSSLNAFASLPFYSKPAPHPLPGRLKWLEVSHKHREPG